MLRSIRSIFKRDVSVSRRRLKRRSRISIDTIEQLEVRAMLAGVQWPLAAGGNGHWYEVVQQPLSWWDAKTAAEARGGYLATVTSASEQAFLQSLSPGSTWLGGYQDRGSIAYSEPGGGWRWVTSEPWAYTNWDPREPNNSGGEDYLELAYGSDYAGKWNDSGSVTFPFIVEYGTTASPTNITLSATSITENQPSGTIVGTFTTTDPDAGDTFTYSLVSGSGDADNSAFAIVGNELRTAARFDFEVKNSYSVRVRTTDATGLTFEKVLTISVIAVNEAPTKILLSSLTVPENAPIGTVVGTLFAVDPDAGDTLTYSFEGGSSAGDNALFTIVGNELRTAAVFDYEARSNYNIRLRATDAGGLSYPSITASAPIAFFDNGSYTDLAGESANVTASLSRMGYSRTAFSGIAASDWRTATATTNLLVIPELEKGDLYPVLSADTRTALRDYVGAGGGLVMFMTQPGAGLRVSSLLNGVFGFSIGAETQLSAASNLDTLAATGSAFAAGPASLPASNATMGVPTSSLPAGAKSLYQAGTSTSVFSATYGTGTIAILGFDWFLTPTPTDWEAVLGLAVTATRGPTVESFDISITNVNEAPALATSASPALIASPINAVAPAAGSIQGSTLVSALIGGALANYSDVDGDLPGIAITGMNLRGGRLWYSIDAGGRWREITYAADSFATLLHANDATRLYFMPAGGFNGTIDDAVSFRAWDRTGGYANGTTGINTQIDDPIVGGYDTTGTAYGITLASDGRYAFVADGASGLQVIDLANPASPTRVGGFDTTGTAWSITLSTDGRYTFVADGASGLQVIDLANPASPTRVGGFDTTGTAYGITLSADGRYAFVADGVSGLQVIDLANPASPTRVGGFDTVGTAWSVKLSADGRCVFVADLSSGLQVIDVSNPAGPTRIRGYDTSGSAYGVTLSSDGRYAFVADASSGLQVIDLVNPASSTQIGGFDTTGTAYGITLSADGRHAFVADGASGLQVIDVTNPASPKRIGGFDTTGTAYGIKLASDGRYAFVADGASGVQVIDLANLANPTRIGGFDTTGTAWSITLSTDGRYAFVADGVSGLQVIDIANPASPTRIGGFDTTGTAYGSTLSADGRYAFVADGVSGLQVIDLANPASPTRIGGFDTTGTAWGVKLSADGRYAFVTDLSGGLQAIDVSNLAIPTRVGGLDTLGSAYDLILSADNRLAFVADSSAGLQVFDATIGRTPFSKSKDTAAVLVTNQPLDVILSVTSVAENQPAGTVVGILSTADPNVGDTFTYTLVAGKGDTDNTSFTIIDNTLKTAASFNYETKGSYSIRVQTIDSTGLTFEKSFTVMVTDVNEAPTAVTLAGVSSSLPENTVTTGRVKVADIVVTDDALGDNVFGLSGADATSFEIIGTVLYLRAGTQLDYETKRSFDVTVSVDDPTVARPSLLTAYYDPTTGNIKLQNTSGGTQRFQSFDILTLGNGTFGLVSGRPGNVGFLSEGTVNLPTAEFPWLPGNPFGLNGIYSQVGAANIGSPVLSLTSYVGWGAGSPVGSAGSFWDLGDIAVKGMTQGDLNARFLTDPEITPPAFNASAYGKFLFSYQQTGGSFSATMPGDVVALLRTPLKITVTDVNEAPTKILLSKLTIPENAPIGTVVGTLSAIDPDAGDTFTYSFVGGSSAGDNALFTIVGNELRTAAVFDYEARSNYNIRLRATDAGGLSYPSITASSPIAYFDNGTYTDLAQESKNLAAALTTLGHAKAVFTGIAAADWTAAAGASNLLVIPELDLGDLNAALAGDARTAIRNYVNEGGGLLVFQGVSGSSRLVNLLNGTFGFALGTISVSTPQTLNAATAAGTPFVSGPTSLESTANISGVTTASLPLGAKALYQTGTATTVFTATYGKGTITMLGLDWASSTANWNTVLGLAVTATRGLTGESFDISVADVLDEWVIDVPEGQTVVDTFVRSGPMKLIKQGLGTLILVNANSHSGGILVEAGEVVVRNVFSLGSGPLEIRAVAKVSLDVGSVNWNGGSNYVSLPRLQIDPAGRFELGVGQIRVAADGFDAALIRQALIAGRAGGSWQGGTSGIGFTSSSADDRIGRAIGYRTMPTTGELRLGFAAVGDANLDGQVNTTDAALIANGGKLGQGSSTGAAWAQGDFNYSGGVTTTDLTMLNNAQLFGKGSYLPAASSLSSPTGASGGSTIFMDMWIAYALSSDSPTAKKKR